MTELRKDIKEWVLPLLIPAQVALWLAAIVGSIWSPDDLGFFGALAVATMFGLGLMMSLAMGMFTLSLAVVHMCGSRDDD